MIEASQEEYKICLKNKNTLKICLCENNFDNFILVNDEVVEFIQEVKLNIKASKQHKRIIEVVFPKYNAESEIAKNIMVNVEKLSKFPNIKISFIDIETSNHISYEKSNSYEFVSSDKDFEKSLEIVKNEKQR